MAVEPHTPDSTEDNEAKHMKCMRADSRSATDPHTSESTEDPEKAGVMTHAEVQRHDTKIPNARERHDKIDDRIPIVQ